MKNARKVSVLLVLALALSLGLAASVWAEPMCEGMGHGPEMMNLTADQADKIFDLKEKMHADTASLRKQLMIKHLELASLWKAEKPDLTAIQAKQKELNALRDQMQDKMTAFRFEAKKVAPNFGMGMGMGGMGTITAARTSSPTHLFADAYLRTGRTSPPSAPPNPAFADRIEAMVAHFCALYDRDAALFRFMLIAQHDFCRGWATPDRPRSR